jgi:hypothetical protein
MAGMAQSYASTRGEIERGGRRFGRCVPAPHLPLSSQRREERGAGRNASMDTAAVSNPRDG